MLVLTRKLDESIIIGNDILVKIVSIAGNQVHVGISAPRHIPIYRQEVYDQVRAGNREAVHAPGGGEAAASFLVGLLRRGGPGAAPTPATLQTGETKPENPSL